MFLPTHIPYNPSRRTFPFFAAALTGVFAALATGCAVGPDHQKPDTTALTAPAYAGAGPWRTAVPRDHLPKDRWWSIYKDPVLDHLIGLSAKDSPSLVVALERLEQARAAAGIVGAALWPKVSGDAAASRSRTARNSRTEADAYTQNNFSLGVDLTYEIDLWGRVRRQNEAAEARAEVSAADYNNVRLVLQADIARTYFAIRALDAEAALEQRNITSRRNSLNIVSRRQELGAGTKLDTRLAEAELAASEAELAAIERARTALRHSLAVLCGQPPTRFTMDSNPSVALADPPDIPAGLPSELLERRPDIASAERAVAAANAEIGAAKAAFFPTIVLFANAGFASADVKQIFDWQSRVWSFGPTLTMPFFEGGRLRAAHRQALSRHRETLANYRLTVLNAFAEVETCLSDLQHLATRSEALRRAAAASKEAATLANERYVRGYDNYIDALSTERIAIANERLDVQVRGEQLVASVLLVKAIGGGWAVPEKAKKK
ncbi:MAG: efflux transporter outer membrane subunit [Puniceicoccales bacterium]|jgi:multidrug efflux system outer membrane protein|nr:efflux transporter outer membrane subunit [Puniceicoccales bacterium]